MCQTVPKYAKLCQIVQNCAQLCLIIQKSLIKLDSYK